ncbi:MAG: redoxin family protein [Chitinophagaceae bacterium]|nr:redoxin family protein [Chitinophagaceae bacterium]
MMIRTGKFWFGAIAFAIIPLLAIDIFLHYLDWQKEVREELIIVVQNLYSFDKQWKASILDNVFERNQTLMFLIYAKIFSMLILSVLSAYFFYIYKKEQRTTLLKPFFYTIIITACFIAVKLFLVTRINTNENIRFITTDTNFSSFQKLYADNFKGRVLYIDFWGTTCGPCLQEFRNFTKPLKTRYKNRNDIAYLYIAQGNEYLWRKQIEKYDIEGVHIFLSASQYDKLYKTLTNDSSILMPHYLITDKLGNIVEANAKQPSEGDSLYLQLDKYLVEK